MQSELQSVDLCKLDGHLARASLRLVQHFKHRLRPRIRVRSLVSDKDLLPLLQVQDGLAIVNGMYPDVVAYSLYSLYSLCSLY